jgi:hypothetical protein
LIRVWEKKRGQRQTGSKLVGGLGEILFFGLMLALGVALMVALVTRQLSNPTTLGFFESQVAFWLVVLVLMSFIVIGGSGMFYAIFHVGASAERRSSLARRAADIDLIRETLTSSRNFPAVPHDANLTNSPGITLAYRLPIEQSSAWRIAAASAFTIVWNAMAVFLLVIATQRYLRGEADLFLALFVIPFVIIGLWAIYHLLRQFLLQTGIGPTSVEISHHPLLPGGRYEVFVTQAGNAVLKRFRLSLICAEEASYSHGTDVRTETLVVHRQEVFRREDSHIEPARPFEHQSEFTVPATAMHSFQAGHNAIHWRLVVHGKPKRWPSFERSFPVIVYPSTAEGREA